LEFKPESTRTIRDVAKYKKYSSDLGLVQSLKTLSEKFLGKKI
jgi:hypothetical protein